MATPQLFDESKALDRLTARLADEATERERYDAGMVEGHYLKNARCAGQSLRYIIELDGQWVALLTFSAAALHLKARDKFIAWSARQRARRLALIVNNSLFCLLLDRARYPNLASKALSLVLRRLSDDWLQHWGHPVLAVESFVDESRYPGACYRACGFKSLGATAGFGRTAKYFSPNASSARWDAGWIPRPTAVAPPVIRRSCGCCTR